MKNMWEEKTISGVLCRLCVNRISIDLTNHYHQVIKQERRKSNIRLSIKLK